MNRTYSKKFKPTSKKKEINNINIDPSIRKEMEKRKVRTKTMLLDVTAQTSMYG